MRGCWLIALTTMREAARRRLVTLGMLVGAAYLLLYGLAIHFATANPGNIVNATNRLIAQQAANLFELLGLYAANLLVATLSVLAACDAISGEVASGAIQTLVSKPLPRWQLVLGKWLGFVGLLTLFQVLLLGGVLAIGYGFTGVSLNHTPAGLGLLWMEMVLLLTITLLFGTRLPTLANGVLGLGLFGMAFLGGWVEQFGAMAQASRAVRLGVAASLLVPSEALWRRAAFEMQSPLMTALRLGPFMSVSVPSGLMVAYAGAYIVAALLGAIWSFQTRDL